MKEINQLAYGFGIIIHSVEHKLNVGFKIRFKTKWEGSIRNFREAVEIMKPFAKSKKAEAENQ